MMLAPIPGNNTTMFLIERGGAVYRFNTYRREDARHDRTRRYHRRRAWVARRRGAARFCDDRRLRRLRDRRRGDDPHDPVYGQSGDLRGGRIDDIADDPAPDQQQP